MLYAAAAFLIALTFALLAYAADRERHYTFAAMLAGERTKRSIDASRKLLAPAKPTVPQKVQVTDLGCGCDPDHTREDFFRCCEDQSSNKQ